MTRQEHYKQGMAVGHREGKERCSVYVRGLVPWREGYLDGYKLGAQGESLP